MTTCFSAVYQGRRATEYRSHTRPGRVISVAEELFKGSETKPALGARRRTVCIKIAAWPLSLSLEQVAHKWSYCACALPLRGSAVRSSWLQGISTFCSRACMARLGLPAVREAAGGTTKTSALDSQAPRCRCGSELRKTGATEDSTGLLSWTACCHARYQSTGCLEENRTQKQPFIPIA